LYSPPLSAVFDPSLRLFWPKAAQIGRETWFGIYEPAELCEFIPVNGVLRAPENPFFFSSVNWRFAS
jgi:hypothetical protein